MWIITEWQHFNAQFEAEEKRALKLREYVALNEKLALKNVALEDIPEFDEDEDSHQNITEFASDQDAFAVTPQHEVQYYISDIIDDKPEGMDSDEQIDAGVFELDDCQKRPLLYRVGLGIIAIVGCVCLLSMPQVPERFLGIRSPQRVLMDYRLTPHPGNDSVLHPVEVNQSHSIHKRHIRIPHKYWVKSRPHNKFKRKKRFPHPQLHAPPEGPAGPVPNPHLVNRRH